MNLDENVVTVLEALDRAKANVPQDWDYLCDDEDVMAQVLEMEYKPKPLGDQLGIGKELFPESIQLEEDEIKIIVEKILEVWAVYHYVADFPDGLPIRVAYEDLLSVWDDVVPCCPEGNFHFIFNEMCLDKYINPKSQDSSNIDLPF